MKCFAIFFLVIVLALSGCESAKNAGFGVNWTFRPAGSEGTEPTPPPPPTPSPTAARQVAMTKAVSEEKPAPPPVTAAKPEPTRPPTVVTEKTESPAPSAPPVVPAREAEIPFGKPVAGKPGFVYSPFDTKGGYVDVTGYRSGSLVKDPYTGKIFKVP